MSDALPFDVLSVPSPCFVVDGNQLRENGKILDGVRKASGAKIILALKAFAMHPGFPLLRPFLNGTTASSLNEALLGKLEFGGEVHTYAVAYSDADFSRLLKISGHISFNSLAQWQHFKSVAMARPDVKYGLRINPQYSEVEVDLYNPCIPGSRFGMTADDLAGADLSGITGLHSHTLCEQGSDVLARTVARIEEKFGDLLHQMEWLNLGGGHHITKPDYDRELLIRTVKHLRETYNLEVILEPGEANAVDAGWLVTEVLDVFESQGIQHAILDASATAHMPDVLEMPYRPHVLGSGEAGEKTYNYKLGGITCLAGDRIGDYSFDQPLKRGDRLVFTDMAIYSMVKTSHFNGVAHPAIALWDGEQMKVTREFGYAAFRDRLG
ncbi:carboxynorspermidine decarboxylase [Kiritimatiellaeota bacterium B1221]|nr:carboxynorspermidine decarboxylase [Kiritimatiellaeota bacterium B1221]